MTGNKGFKNWQRFILEVLGSDFLPDDSEERRSAAIGERGQERAEKENEETTEGI